MTAFLFFPLFLPLFFPLFLPLFFPLFLSLQMVQLGDKSEMCLRSFRHASSCSQHRRTHSEIIMCRACQTILSDRGSLRKHNQKSCYFRLGGALKCISSRSFSYLHLNNPNDICTFFLSIRFFLCSTHLFFILYCFFILLHFSSLFVFHSLFFVGQEKFFNITDLQNHLIQKHSWTVDKAKQNITEWMNIRGKDPAPPEPKVEVELDED